MCAGAARWRMSRCRDVLLASAGLSSLTCRSKLAPRAPLAPPPLEKGRSLSPALPGEAGGDQESFRRRGVLVENPDPHPARKCAPTSPFQGEVEQVALPRAQHRNSRAIALLALAATLVVIAGAA